MSPFTHTLLAYLVAVGLLWGYAMKLWWSLLRLNTDSSKPIQRQENIPS
jgi:hypothetical protein